MNLYSIYNKTAHFYNAPFAATCDAEAKALVMQGVKGSQADLEDFSLVQVGFFDHNSGDIRSDFEKDPRLVCECSIFKKEVDA